MTVIGNPRSFHKKFKFIVEIDDVGHAGFQKCSELSVEVANVQYFEGGSLIPNKSPGRLTFADVTLERGATQDRDLFDWFQDVAITSSGLGLTDVNYKRNLDIVQQDRDGTTLRRWSLSRAWPVKFVAGDWDNEADENVIESVTLRAREWTSRSGRGARGGAAVARTDEAMPRFVEEVRAAAAPAPAREAPSCPFAGP